MNEMLDFKRRTNGNDITCYQEVTLNKHRGQP